MKNDEFLSEREVMMELLKELREIKAEIKARMPNGKKIDLGVLDAADVLSVIPISP